MSRTLVADLGFLASHDVIEGFSRGSEWGAEMDQSNEMDRGDVM